MPPPLPRKRKCRLKIYEEEDDDDVQREEIQNPSATLFIPLIPPFPEMSIAASISPRYRETLYKEEFDRFSTTKKHHTYSHRDILEQKKSKRKPPPAEGKRERDPYSRFPAGVKKWRD